MEHFRLFVLPFWIGAGFLLIMLMVRFVGWFVKMEPSDRHRFWRSLFTKSTIKSLGEVVRESLLHLKIWRRNPVLGYMHTTFALGWFLLILVGWIETMVYFKGENVPLYVDIFFSYYVHPVFEHNFNFSLIKDFLLLLLLIGVGLALAKRLRSKMMGLRRTTRHTLGDRVALTALWTIFPARLLAEGMTSGVIREFGGIVWAMGDNMQRIPPGIGCGSFLTNSFGDFLVMVLPEQILRMGELPAWWLYSLALGVFFVALPFSRYLHIFSEIPLIILRNSGIRSKEKPKSYDDFQIAACSRCGICIDPCQLQKSASINTVQSVYFLRDRRSKALTEAVADNCLMCGRCEAACPVGIQLNTLRLNSRQAMTAQKSDRFQYLETAKDPSQGVGRVGYFAGCMTMLTPRILQAMETIFEASGESVWWADRDGGVCCGRPLKLSGEIEAARKLMDFNIRLFREHGITTLVTSCPICLKVFREDYHLNDINVIHHSQYIEQLITSGRINLKAGSEKIVYHDPCELGRGSNIYEAPRAVISQVGELCEANENRADALCCGSSLANTAITECQQQLIANDLTTTLEASGADSIATACPLCKKAITRTAKLPVLDIAEIVARSI